MPALADVCVIDVLRDGQLERLGVVARGPDRERTEERLRRGADLEAVRAGHARLLDPGDEAHRSGLTVPLRSRGQTVGALTLMAARRIYTPADLEFAELLAGRVGLALDNAGMFAELESLGARLTTALGTLAEAVTIQDERGRLVYANDAAAAALGFPSGAALMAIPPREIVDSYESFHEDGSPLRLEELPGRLVLEGHAPEPLLVRAVDRRTGEERWRVVKATGVPASAGSGRLAVNVIEDVTDVKRAELAQRFLAEASAVLASARDYEETLARIAELAVPRLADWCVVTLPDEDDRLRSVAVAHVDPAKVRFARDYQQRHPAGPRLTDRRRAGAARGRLAAHQRDLGGAAGTGDHRSRAARRGRQPRDARGDDGADAGRRARDRRDQLRQRGIPAQLRAGRAGSRRGARPARGDRGGERAAVPRALAHRGHAPARTAAGGAARHPGPAARVAVPAGGGGEPGRRRLLRRVPDRLRAGCCSSATSPAAGPRPRR